MSTINSTLKKEVRNKYNTLYMEVAKYYGIAEHIKISNNDSVYYIPMQKLGINSVNAIEVCAQYEKRFPYLVPFYRIFNRHIFLNTTIEFREINRVIKKIRKENLVTKK